MNRQTTGFLATECPSCGGSGDITWLQGMEQLRRSAPCDECSGTGFLVDRYLPAISLVRLNEIVTHEINNPQASDGATYRFALRRLLDRAYGEFKEAQ